MPAVIYRHMHIMPHFSPQLLFTNFTNYNTRKAGRVKQCVITSTTCVDNYIRHPTCGCCMGCWVSLMAVRICAWDALEAGGAGPRGGCTCGLLPLSVCAMIAARLGEMGSPGCESWLVGEKKRLGSPSTSGTWAGG